MAENDIATKYKIPPYKMVEYTKTAQKLISTAMKDSTVFLKPYKSVELFEE